MPRIASYSATYFLARLALRLRLWPNPRLDRASSDEWEDLRDPRFYYYLWEGFSNLFIFLFYLSQFSINEFPVKLMKLNRRNVPFFDVLSISWWNFSNLVEDRDNSDLKHKKKKERKIPVVFVPAQSMARSSAAISFVTAGSACFSNVIEFRPASRHSLCNWPPIPVPWRSFAYVKELPPGEKLVRQTFLQNFTFERPSNCGQEAVVLVATHSGRSKFPSKKGGREKEKRFTCRRRIFLSNVSRTSLLSHPPIKLLLITAS